MNAIEQLTKQLEAMAALVNDQAKALQVLAERDAVKERSLAILADAHRHQELTIMKLEKRIGKLEIQLAEAGGGRGITGDNDRSVILPFTPIEHGRVK